MVLFPKIGVKPWPVRPARAGRLVPLDTLQQTTNLDTQTGTLRNTQHETIIDSTVRPETLKRQERCRLLPVLGHSTQRDTHPAPVFIIEQGNTSHMIGNPVTGLALTLTAALVRSVRVDEFVNLATVHQIGRGDGERERCSLVLQLLLAYVLQFLPMSVSQWCTGELSPVNRE